MKKNEKRRAKFNFQNAVIVLCLFILFSFSYAYARQFVKQNNAMLLFPHLCRVWQSLEEKESKKFFLQEDFMFFLPYYHAWQSVKEDDTILSLSYYEDRQSLKEDDIKLFFPYYYTPQSMKKDDTLLLFSNLYAQKGDTLHHAYARQSAMTGYEYRVKAGFIYNFAKFTKWLPSSFESPKSPIQLCFISDKSDRPEAEMLSTLNGKQIRHRKIIVKNKNNPLDFIPLLDTITQKKREPEDMTGCHILFISSQDKDFIREQLKAAEDKNILTIGETEDFAKMCGIIRLFQTENRLRFEVNLGAAQRAGLKLGAPLLMSAEIVKECQQ